MAHRVALPYLSSAGLASTSVGSSVTDQYGGPIGVQGFPQALGSHNAAQVHLPLPLPSNKQIELLERLKQLRAWQQQQQADLLRQQQEQLLKLRNEQITLRPALVDQGGQDGQAKSTDEAFDGHARTEEAHINTQDSVEEENDIGRLSNCHLSPDDSETVPESMSNTNLVFCSDGDGSSYQHCAASQDDSVQEESETCSGSDNEECHGETDFCLVSIEHVAYCCSH